MLVSVFYFAPLLMCLLWAAIFTFRKKNLTQRLLRNIFFLGSFYFLTYAFYISPQTDYLWMCRLDMVNVFVILLLLPQVLVYIHAHLKMKMMSRNLRLLLMMPAFVEGSIVALLYFIIGVDRAAELHGVVDRQVSEDGTPYLLNMNDVFQNHIESCFWFFSNHVVGLLALLYVLGIIYMCFYVSIEQGYSFGDAYKFFFKGKDTTPSRAVNLMMALLLLCFMPLIIFGRAYMMSHSLLGMCLSLVMVVFIFCIAYVEYFEYSTTVSLHGLTNANFISTGAEKDRGSSDEVEMVTENTGIAENSRVEKDVKSDEQEKAEGVEDNENKKVAEGADSPLFGSFSIDIVPTRKVMTLAEQLRIAIDENNMFKNPALTLQVLAESLNTNRTTLSGFINTTYGMSFKTFLSIKRVECAKRYMLKNPLATLEDVAQESGFNDSASLCHKFKDVAGVSPKAWLAGNRG